MSLDDTILILEPRERSLTDDIPLDERGDAAVLAQVKRAYEEHLASQAKAKTESCLRFAEIRHQARQKLIEQGHLVDVLRADAALEGSVSDAESIVEAALIKAGVEEPIADLTVKFAKQQAEALGDLASGHMCGGIDKAEGVDL